MFNMIMVPLDGSAMAEQALPTAARLARATGAALHLVHVHVAASPNPVLVEGLPVVDEELRSLAAEHERVYLERVATKLTNEHIQPVAVRLTGAVVPTLTSYARDSQASLLVMTTHGRSGFDHLWLGSIAEALVRVTSTPLLLLRPDAAGTISDQPFQRVLVPLDGSPLAEEILPHVVELAKLDGSAVVALRVIDTLPVPTSMPFHEHFRINATTLAQERAQAETYLHQLANNLPAITETHVIEAEVPARAILEFANANGADLVAVTTHGHSARTRVPLSSVTDKVLRGATQALLILRPGMGHAD